MGGARPLVPEQPGHGASIGDLKVELARDPMLAGCPERCDLFDRQIIHSAELALPTSVPTARHRISTEQYGPVKT